ncbi:metal ABC transporter permease [Actinomadura scrupuli]|uniref:metal ABC transporter permease n=1 Tax=Actinomadura scrupuli TaxID=559629 RepID=UPI003D96BAE5
MITHTLVTHSLTAQSQAGQGIWQEIFNFTGYSDLLVLIRNSLIAGAVLGLVGGLVGTFVMMRDLAFAVHGIAELSFAGASAALLAGINIVGGSIGGALLAAAIIGVLGVAARDRNSLIGVLMPFGLGLGVLFLSLYKGRAANKFGILTGQIVAVDTPQMTWLIGTSLVVLAGLAIVWRPLTFASLDADVAAARGVPVGGLSLAFMLLLGLAVAIAIQVVGALLVLSLVCTPAAAAMRITASPILVPALSVLFATTSVVGGILLALGSSIPISPYVTTLSFGIYLTCRLLGRARTHAGRTTRVVPSAT